MLGGTERVPKRPRPHWRVVCLLAAVGMAFVAAVLLFLRSEPPSKVGDTEARRPSAHIAEAKPAIATKPVPVEPAAVSNSSKRVITREEQKRLRPGDEGFDPAAHPTILIPRKKPEENLPYRSSTEQSLLWIINCEPGDAPLPLIAIPRGELKRMAEILVDKCEEEEGDSEWTRQQRENLRIAKAEMAKYIKEGGDPQSFLQYYHDRLEEMHTERSIALDSVMKLLREGGNDDIAGDYLSKVNKRLADKGIKPIVLSKKKMARHGLVSTTDGTEEKSK